MKRSRSLVLLATAAGVAACADQASTLLAPRTAAESNSSGSGSSGGGYTWTIKKTLVEVHKVAMELDNVVPYSLAVGEIKWFTFLIEFTRTNGGNMGPTAVITDDVAGACAVLGPNYECTSADSDFGIPGMGGQVGIKTWTVSSTGRVDGILDIEHKRPGCPSNSTLTNTAVLTSNGKVISSAVGVPLTAPGCVPNQPPPGQQKPKCNQGVGNGPEGCDPGNSNHNQPSNDENGGTPGNPGRRG